VNFPTFNSAQAMEQTAIILQARTGSTRLPNKVMRLLGGVPMLSHCIARLRRVGAVIVATSDLPMDDFVEQLAGLENVYCFRGSENDVLDRYYQAAKIFNLEYIVRATGDNPFVDPNEARRVVNHIVDNKVDYVTGAEVVEGLGLPVGVGIEAFTFNALERSWLEGHAENHREHLNEYILENPDSFNIVRLKCLQENSCPDLRLTVDTDNDFSFVEETLKRIRKPVFEISTQEIIGLWQERKK